MCQMNGMLLWKHQQYWRCPPSEVVSASRACLGFPDTPLLSDFILGDISALGRIGGACDRTDWETWIDSDLNQFRTSVSELLSMVKAPIHCPCDALFSSQGSSTTTPRLLGQS